MSDWEIKPYKGIGPLRLDMPRNEVHSLLGNDFRTVRGTMDAYRKLGVHCHFDSEDKLEFVQVMKRCSATYKGQKLFECDIAAVVALFSEGVAPVKDFESYRFPTIGVTMYTPRDEAVEAVGVYRKGYFEEPANE